MPAASRPEQISSLMPRSRNGTACAPLSAGPATGPAASPPGPEPGRAVTDPGDGAGACASSPLKVWVVRGSILHRGPPQRFRDWARRVRWLPAVARRGASCNLVADVATPTSAATAREPATIVRDTAVYSGFPPGTPGGRLAKKQQPIGQHDIWLRHSIDQSLTSVPGVGSAHSAG